MKIIYNGIKNTIIILYNIMNKILKVDSNIILFESSVGRNYTGNPKYIYEKMIQENLDKKYKCVWVINNTDIQIPGKCLKVKRLRFRYFMYMSRAKVWIVDSRQPNFIKKKKECIYLQTWHGTPLKKLGLDMDFVNMGGYKDIEEYKMKFIDDTRKWDYLISQNRYSSNIFKRAFDFNKKILEIGYPRNDILIKDDDLVKIKFLKQKRGIPLDKKIILYAPTWRDDKYHTNGEYKFTTDLNIERVLSEIGEDYFLIIKPHYLVVDKIEIENKKIANRVLIANIEQDIQELYLISDILITDYSSVMFDYSILKRPIIFYLSDIEEYQANSRGFYFDIIEQAPGKIALTTNEVIDAINNVERDIKVYQDKYESFNKMYNNLECGDASSKVINLINEITGNN